ncbi:MAG: response regulator transcription factor [Oscillospiraceae bacterium]|nr:response regulator transcription factor [Oscillospiraceae bacterium]
MIYFVEDDASIRELVQYTLQSSGMECRSFPDPAAFRRAMEKAVPELVMLDIMLPGEDGLSLLRWIRQTPATADLPVMMVTAKASEYEKVIGLDAGADDYLPKPFGMMELIARVRALLRRTKKRQARDEEHVFRLGTLFVDEERHVVQVDGRDVTLTFKEFSMLCLLLRNRGRVLTREQFLDKVWGYAFDGENRTVDVHIRTLRQKLGDAGRYILTIRGIGYKIGENEHET